MEQSEKIVEEVKEKVAKRIPPGDRWSVIDKPQVIHKTLTDTLEAIYNQKGYTQFYMDAREGYVYVVRKQEKVAPPPVEKRWSLYGED